MLGGCRVGAGLIAAGAGFQTAEAESRTSRPSRGLKWEEDLIDARPPCARETVGTASQRSRPRTVSMNNRRDDWDPSHTALSAAAVGPFEYAPAVSASRTHVNAAAASSSSVSGGTVDRRGRRRACRRKSGSVTRAMLGPSTTVYGIESLSIVMM